MLLFVLWNVECGIDGVGESFLLLLPFVAVIFMNSSFRISLQTSKTDAFLGLVGCSVDPLCVR